MTTATILIRRDMDINRRSDVKTLESRGSRPVDVALEREKTGPRGLRLVAHPPTFGWRISGRIAIEGLTASLDM